MVKFKPDFLPLTVLVAAVLLRKGHAATAGNDDFRKLEFLLRGEDSTESCSNITDLRCLSEKVETELPGNDAVSEDEQ